MKTAVELLIFKKTTMIPSHFQKFIPTLKRILPYVEMLSLLALALYLLFKESHASEIAKVLTVLLSSVSLLYVLVSTKQWETRRETFIHKATGKPARLAVDHCHVKGSVRKLLCKSCNNGLGLFKDNPELLEKAADYLRNHNGT